VESARVPGRAHHPRVRYRADVGRRLAAAITRYGAERLPRTAAAVNIGLIAGIAALVVLVVEQFRKEDPLMPVRALSTSLPVTGTITAMIAGMRAEPVVQKVVS
jgi:hypothetical protein